MSRTLWFSALFALASLVAFAGHVASTHGLASFSYLPAFSFGATTALGGLALLMVAWAAGASWFLVVRRLVEAIASCLVLLPVAMVPLALALPRIYPWAQAGPAGDERVQRAIVHAQGWMNSRLFLTRALAFMLLWIGLAELLRHASLAQDRGPGDIAARRQRVLSAAGLPLLVLSGTFAVFDWVMSAVPGWNFNVIGLYVLTGGFSAATGVTTVALWCARRNGVLPQGIGPAHAHALGRLLLTSVCLWAYLAASQLVVVWSANLPSEAGFYLARYQGGFRALSWLLLLGHFALPFLILLSRRAKESLGLMACVGGWLAIMHAVDTYWLLMPAAPLAPSAWDFTPYIGVSLLFAVCGVVRFRRAPPMPVQPSQFERALGYESP